MKACVLIFYIFSINGYVNAFENNKEHNTEDEGRSLIEYHKLGEETLNNDGRSTNYNGVSNGVPNEGYEKIKAEIYEAAPEIPFVTTSAAIQDPKKPFYDETDAPELFQKFIKDYNKQYKDDGEIEKRYQNFARNLKTINQLNKENDATFDINMFADLGEGESPIGSL